MRRFLLVALGLVVELLLLSHWSGNQPRLDAVAATRRELGIELDARKVPVGEVELFVVRGGPADGWIGVSSPGFSSRSDNSTLCQSGS